MNFNETQAEILANAYLLAVTARVRCSSRGRTRTPWRSEEAGWLERRYVDATGDWSWHRTQQAESALDLNALTASATGPGSQN